MVLRRVGHPPILARIDKDDYFGEARHTLDAFGAFTGASLLPGSKRPDAKPSRKEEAEIFYGDDVAGVVLQIARLF